MLTHAESTNFCCSFFLLPKQRVAALGSLKRESPLFESHIYSDASHVEAKKAIPTFPVQNPSENAATCDLAVDSTSRHSSYEFQVTGPCRSSTPSFSQGPRFAEHLTQVGEALRSWMPP